MILIGVHQGLLKEAERSCPGAFRAWVAEVGVAGWRSFGDVLVRYPRCRHLEGVRYHFPLGPQDFGLRADVIFDEPDREGCVHAIAFAPALRLSAAVSASDAGGFP